MKRVLILIPLLMIYARIAGAQSSPQENLHYQVFEDHAAGVVVTFIKDSLGNIYQLTPAGPKLPWGVSKATMEAQAKRYGLSMISWDETVGLDGAQRI